MKESIVVSRHRHVKNLEAALNLVKDGCSVFPLYYITDKGHCSCGNQNCSRPGKHPLISNGLNGASNDIDTVEFWWDKSPFANIGIRTGKISNIVVLDVDLKDNGFDSLKKLEESHSTSLNNFTSVISGAGGKHFYFLAPERDLPNRVGMLPGVDFRAEGGYIVAPPSNHMSGKEYVWDVKNPLELPPQWLIDLVLGSKEIKSTNETTSISKLVAEDFIPEGSRNNFLASLAGFLKSRGLKETGLEKALLNFNQNICIPPLCETEVKTITKSIGKYKTWKEITPLETKKSNELKKLTPEMLPKTVRDWVADISERMQLPLEFMAVPAIVSISTLIGRKINIHPLQNDDWTVVPNLWGMLVAEPGSMKSPVIARIMEPVYNLEKQARNHFKKETKELVKKEKELALEMQSLTQAMKMDWNSAMGSEVARKKELIREINQLQENKIKHKRYITNDTTIEKLAMIMEDNPQGVLLLRDELSGWLEGLSKSGREGSREFYLEAWNGNGTFSIDRVGRESTYVESMSLAIFGGIQPEKLQKYIARYEADHGQDGFFRSISIVYLS